MVEEGEKGREREKERGNQLLEKERLVLLTKRNETNREMVEIYVDVLMNFPFLVTKALTPSPSLSFLSPTPSSPSSKKEELHQSIPQPTTSPSP